ncbi:MAG: hypothetical protein K9L68_08685, partial [Spirochaetales bacterium]|nr:hypothetical protein [Spirochaetales bacterium]
AGRRGRRRGRGWSPVKGGGRYRPRSPGGAEERGRISGRVRPRGGRRLRRPLLKQLIFAGKGGFRRAGMGPGGGRDRPGGKAFPPSGSLVLFVGSNRGRP